ncbi:cytochrome P450 [Streptomyces syringium]|uniref:Pentalenene oxygenase n=1 Tax=Streptomyces syringium TaxID=76729 RepID=A0ABS4XYI6_9ACTN|nr:cytochrome P450 [Streptomyces syringium]MBP2400768.1 pentalenene oxygenase [Streptomyces syringium]
MTDTETTWKAVAAPGGLPLVGHLFQLRRGLLPFIQHLPARGDLVQIRIGPWHAYVVCHPDLVEQVLRRDRIFDKGGPVFDKVRSVMGNGLVTCPYRDHRRQRRLLQPLFQKSRMPAYARVMTEQIGSVLGSWHEGKTLRVSAEMHMLAARIVARALFSSDPEEPDDVAARASQVVEASLGAVMQGIYRHMVTPVPALRRLPTPGNRSYHQARADIHTAVSRVLAAYRRDGADHGDLVSALLAARDTDGSALEEAEIHDQITTMLVAGIESTANGLTWALYTLATTPGLQTRVQAEADSILAGRTATWEDLPHLDLTGRVVCETLRMYAPAWALTRVTREATELAGQRLPAGTHLLYSPYAIHHRPDLYPHPERFDVDRWLPDQAAARPRNAYLPFAAGARKCIGDTFSLVDSTLTLASIAARWHIHPPPKPATPAARITLTPKKLELRVTSRSFRHPTH